MIRAISYNLRKHKAATELDALSQTPDLDVLCLQEAISTQLPQEIGNLHLADSTKNNRCMIGFLAPLLSASSARNSLIVRPVRKSSWLRSTPHL